MNRIECIKNIKQYLLEQVENKVNFLNRCTLDIYGVNATKEQAIYSRCRFLHILFLELMQQKNKLYLYIKVF